MGAKISAGGGGRNPYPANAEMNVTPFVDVMLVLLIIFMIAAPLSTVSIPVELPPATTKPTEQKTEPIFVSIEKDGTLYVMNEKTTLAELPAMLLTKTRGNTEERVYLRADQSLNYGAVVNVMNTMQDSGFYKVGLVAEEVPEGNAEAL